MTKTNDKLPIVLLVYSNGEDVPFMVARVDDIRVYPDYIMFVQKGVTVRIEDYSHYSIFPLHKDEERGLVTEFKQLSVMIEQFYTK